MKYKFEYDQFFVLRLMIVGEIKSCKRTCVCGIAWHQIWTVGRDKKKSFKNRNFQSLRDREDYRGNWIQDRHSDSSIFTKCTTAFQPWPLTSTKNGANSSSHCTTTIFPANEEWVLPRACKSMMIKLMINIFKKGAKREWKKYTRVLRVRASKYWQIFRCCFSWIDELSIFGRSKKYPAQNHWKKRSYRLFIFVQFFVFNCDFRLKKNRGCRESREEHT